MTEREPTIRLFVDARLEAGAEVDLAAGPAHYLMTVMRTQTGDRVLLFSGRDGEWRARLVAAAKGSCRVMVEDRTRPQAAEPGPWLLFAPIKKDRLDYLVEKATELGAERLWPVLTARTNVARVNLDRLRAQVVQAAEQCERLTVPEVMDPLPLPALPAHWPAERRLYVLAERGPGLALAAALAAAPGDPPGFLVGPEGGWMTAELDGLLALPFVSVVTLGRPILRSETAAAAALAAWQALAGAWRRDRPQT